MRAWWLRWSSFNLVGILGVGVQLLILKGLLYWTDLHYLVATAVAVEVALLHNFVWHLHWTWSDRAPLGEDASHPGPLARLLSFHLSNGTISLAGNLLCMSLLIEQLGLAPLLANLGAIGASSILNFIACDRFVFAGQAVDHPPTLQGGCK